MRTLAILFVLCQLIVWAPAASACAVCMQCDAGCITLADGGMSICVNAGVCEPGQTPATGTLCSVSGPVCRVTGDGGDTPDVPKKMRPKIQSEAPTDVLTTIIVRRPGGKIARAGEWFVSPQFKQTMRTSIDTGGRAIVVMQFTAGVLTVTTGDGTVLEPGAPAVMSRGYECSVTAWPADEPGHTSVFASPDYDQDPTVVMNLDGMPPPAPAPTLETRQPTWGQLKQIYR